MQSFLSRIIFLFLIFSIVTPAAGAERTPLSPLCLLLLQSKSLFDPPTDLRISVNTEGNVVLSWQDNSRTETGFVVERKFLLSAEYTAIHTTRSNVTTFVDSGLTGYSCNLPYIYRIKAIKDGSSTAYSNNLGVSVPCSQDLPAKPANLILSFLTANAIRLSWTDQASNEDGFIILRKKDSESNFSEIYRTGGNITRYDDSDITPATNYDYAVAAFNAHGTSQQITASITTTSGFLAPPSYCSIYGLCTHGRPGCIRVSWNYYDPTLIDGLNVQKKCWRNGDPEPDFVTAPWNNLPESTGFNWNYSSDETCATSDPTLWKFKVLAFTGESINPTIYSDPQLSNIYARCPDFGTPSIYGLTATVLSSSSIDLSWNDFANRETGWNLIRKEMDGQIIIASTFFNLDANLDHYTDTPLKPSTEYSYTVTPEYYSPPFFNCRSTSMQITENNVTTNPAANLPTAPSSLTVNQVIKSSESLHLEWSDNSTNEDGFQIFRSSDGIDFASVGTVGANITSYDDNMLNPCSSYYYKVAAYNGDGSSAESSGGPVITPPAPPTGLITTIGPGVFSVNLDWNDTMCATKYHIYYIDTPGGTYQRIDDGTLVVSEENVIDVPADTYLFFRVSAENASGNEGSLSCTVSPDSEAHAGATSSNDTCLAAVGWSSSPVPVNVWASWGNYTNAISLGWDSAPLTWDSNGTPETYSGTYYIDYSYNEVDWDRWATVTHPNTPADGVSLVVNITDLPYGGIHLEPNNIWYFRISTHFQYDCSNPPDGIIDECMSNPAFVTGITASTTAPPEQTNILPAPGVTVSSYYLNAIFVGWSTIEGAEGYEVWRSTNRTTEFFRIANFSPATNRFTDNTVAPWTDYWYKVRAYKIVSGQMVYGQWSAAEYGNATDF